jgi:lipopolysaccharide transport system ATP-binding protein
MATAIKVENLSKIYRLGEIGTGTISRDIERFVKTKILKQDDPFLKIGETNDRATKGASDIVYSLKDINFEIEQGDAVGIIGRNGAGKSTLLKILSRVTSPTTGKINIKGRVASLLEVGTGFHPELTGRENIYLNGAILGMRKREIDRKLDEIIDFSGVERYIDTPVKRYSSGMYVRLAFAVAAHLESEILIVDEVLAVGDAEFQKKCLGKMSDVSKGEGRTVLFVSHNMSAVQSLCKKGILLANGLCIEKSDSASLIINNYRKIFENHINQNSLLKLNLEYFNIIDIKLSQNGNENIIFNRSEDIKITIIIKVKEMNPMLNIGISISNSDSNLYWSFIRDYDESIYYQLSKNEVFQFETVIPKNFLNNGRYVVELISAINASHWILEPGKEIVAKKFSIDGGDYGLSMLNNTTRPTPLFPIFKFNIKKLR